MYAFISFGFIPKSGIAEPDDNSVFFQECLNYFLKHWQCRACPPAGYTDLTSPNPHQYPCSPNGQKGIGRFDIHLQLRAFLCVYNHLKKRQIFDPF